MFTPGEVPRNSQVSASIGGVAVALQMDVKTRHADGSANMVVLTAERPDLAAGASVQVDLSLAAGPSGTALNMVNALAGHSLHVTLSGAGIAAQNFDVLGALQQAMKSGTASFWQEGPLATQARVEIDLPGSSRMVFDVTMFRGGGMSVEAQFNNDGAMEAVGGRVSRQLSVTLDGVTSGPVQLDQGQYQNWHGSFSNNARDGGQGLGDPSSGWLNIRHDVENLQDAGAIANYDLTNGVNASLLNSFAAAAAQPGWGAPLGTQGVITYMPGTGGRADIGFTTEANTAWLMTQDARAANYALGQAEAASAAPWHFWDGKNGTWLGTDDYPALWIDPRGGAGKPGNAASTGLTQQPDGATGWTLDTAHQPDLSFVPYVMTGSRWMLDNLQAQASWNLMSQWPTIRGQAQDLVVQDNQVRGAAWSLRQIDEAAWASPTGSAEKADFTEASNANWAWLVSKIPEWTKQQGEAHGWLPGVYGTDGALPPWQQDYFASTAIAAARHGNADALTFLNWQTNFLVGRFTQEKQGFATHDGAAYLIAIADPATGAPYKTWAEIGAKTEALGWSNGKGWSKSEGDYPQLALATLAGIAELTGSKAAAKAYRELLAEAPPFTEASDYARDPTYSLAPPDALEAAPLPGGQPGDGEGVLPGTATPADPVVPPVVPPGAGVLIQLGLSEDHWKGNAEATILLDGVELAAGQVITASHAAGEVQRFDVRAELAPGPHTLTVRFLNDAWGGTTATDRNLYVNSMVVGGMDLQQSATLLANGDALFSFVQPKVGVDTVAYDGVDTLRLGLSADSWLGDPHFLVFVDGQAMGGLRSVAASRAAGEREMLEIQGDFGPGPHQLRVLFLNDISGESAGEDRNLYVDSIALNGTDLHQSAALYTSGDAVFAF